MVFGRRRQAAPTGVTYTRDQFFEVAKNCPQYTILKNAWGNAYAQAVGLSLYGVCQNYLGQQGQPVITRTTAQNAAFPGYIDSFLSVEARNMQRKNTYVTRLQRIASDGFLRPRLERRSMAEAEYGATAAMSDMEKAFRWVCNNWHQEDREGIAGVWGALTQFAGAGGGGVLALGTDARMIKTIHQMIMSQPYPVAFRNVNPNASYPSSMGGNVLMKKIFEGTAGVVFPPPGDDLWYDWALFYMAALVTVQGFVDANKRTGRMAYAVVLVKGGVPFAAPNLDLQNQLFKMEG